jgi:galactokinase
VSGSQSDVASFSALFGQAAAVRAAAPGRVNLIGEHTDYQGGFVLPAAIPQRTTVDLRPRADEVVRIWSAEDPTRAPGRPPSPEEVATYRLGEERPVHGWLDYVQGVTWAARAAGHPIRGFDARLSSQVPLGSGLSSSAALQVGLLRALREAFELPLDDVQLALVAHRAETEFVGAPVGVMDQMASSLADTTSALFLDTRSLAWEKVPLSGSLRLLVIDSGIAHSHATGGYRARRAVAEAAAAELGVALLRDVDPADLPRVEALPEPLGRRARHIVTENARVLAAVAAMRAGDDGRLGALLDESHASLRDDYQVTVPQLDLLVEIARETPTVIGARMTGGGFGGAIVALARINGAADVASGIAAEYRARTGISARVLVGDV